MITTNNRSHSHVKREPTEPEDAEAHENNTLHTRTLYHSLFSSITVSVLCYSYSYGSLLRQSTLVFLHLPWFLDEKLTYELIPYDSQLLSVSLFPMVK